MVNNLREVTWQPSATDAGSGIKTVAYTVNGQAVNLSGGLHRFGASGNGDFALQVVATDNANNQQTWNLTVKLRHPDFNRSGSVDFFDLTQMLQRWGGQSSVYDLDGKNGVDFSDLTILLRNWG